MIGELAIGLVAGVVAGMLGVGGGALFVPALVLFAGLTQIDAEATSLLAIIPVSLVGASRQRSYGNLRPQDAILLGLLAAPSAVLGVAIVNALPERMVELLFAGLLVFIAERMLRDQRAS